MCQSLDGLLEEAVLVVGLVRGTRLMGNEEISPLE